MKAVGLTQLKARLSEYLRPTKAGETMDELAAAGDVTRASQPKKRWTWHVAGAGLPPGTAAELLDALREDR